MMQASVLLLIRHAIITATFLPTVVLSNALLFDSISNHDIKAVSRYLSTDTEIDSYRKDGKTPLHWAAETGFFEAVKALIKHGADVNEKTTSGQLPVLHGYRISGNTALHLAAIPHSGPLIRYLLASGADPYLRNDVGMAPLHYATLVGPTGGELIFSLT